MPDQHPAPLIVHIIFRLGIGGLENGLVNLINGIPGSRFRHAIICVKSATEFATRIKTPGVPILELGKKDGKDVGFYFTMLRALKRLAPDIVHTRNANTLEYQLISRIAGVPHRIHGEHGWDIHDLDGSSVKYRTLRRLAAPFVHSFVTVSSHLESYLIDEIGINPNKVQTISNGVDTDHFSVLAAKSRVRPNESGLDVSNFVIGTIGRMHEVKNQSLLVQAFDTVIQIRPELRAELRLALIGDGPLYKDLKAEVEELGLADIVWMPGETDDVRGMLQLLDVFVLPSMNEGISNTLLEAMASGCPVIATRVGGTPEIVRNCENGILVAAGDVAGMARAVLEYFDMSDKRVTYAKAARQYVEENHSIDSMINRYCALYESVLLGRV